VPPPAASILRRHPYSCAAGGIHTPSISPYLPITPQEIASKLFGDDFEWSVLAAGRHQMPFAT